MPVLAFVFALLAFVVFVVDYVQTKVLIALGLAAFTLAYILQFIIESKTFTL